MGGLRYEVWTLPWSATFERVIADVPVVVGAGSGTVRFNDFASGQMGVPADYSRLSEIIGSATGTLTRVYDGTVIVHEWVAERVAYQVSREAGMVAVLSGPDLASAAFDGTVLYPNDYTVQPTIQPDWIWGGASILSNGGFEENLLTPRVFDLAITATGGTFTLTDGTDTTSTIVPGAAASVIETRMEADLGGYTDVVVVQIAASPTTHRIQMITPGFGETLAVNVGSLTGGTATITVVTEGGLTASPWTPAQPVVSGVPSGTYDDFGPRTVVVRTGTYSLIVDPGPIGVSSNRGLGAQQIITVKPGSTYQISVWINPTVTADKFRVSLVTLGEELIVQDDPDGASYTQNIWSELTLVDVVIPVGVTTAILRVQNTNAYPTNPSVFYIDDATMNLGLVASTIGDIWQQILDDAAVDHSGDARGTILDWVDYTGFDATNDSTTSAWGGVEGITFSRGNSYGQLLDVVRRLGYEFVLTPKASPGATTHDFDLYETGALGTDYTTAATPSIIVGQGVIGGTITQRIPQYTAALVEGADGGWLEATNATPLTDFGRLETYQGDTKLNSATSIASASAHLLSVEVAIQTTAKIKIIRTNDLPVPLVDYTTGDTVNTTFPPVITKTGKRVQQVSYRNTEPVEYIVTVVDP